MIGQNRKNKKYRAKSINVAGLNELPCKTIDPKIAKANNSKYKKYNPIVLI